MEPLIQMNMWVHSLLEHLLKRRALDGQTVLVLEMQETPLPLVWKLPGALPQQNGATTTLKIYLAMSGNSLRVRQVPTSGNQRTTRVRELFQTHMTQVKVMPL